MGDASFDYKSIQTSSEDNTNRVPTYQSYESIHQVQTFLLTIIMFVWIRAKVQI